MKVAKKKKTSRKSLIALFFERLGDTLITTIRIQRLLRSRRGRRRLRDRLKKKRKEFQQHLRGSLERSRLAFRKFRSRVRLERRRLFDFHSRTAVRRLLKIYFIPLVIFSVIACSVMMLGRSSPKALANPQPELARRKTLDDLMSETARLITQKQLEKALGNIAVLHSMSPNNPTVFTFSGAVYSLQKKYARARLYYARALAISPNEHDAQFNLAEVEFISGNYAAAKALFLKMQGARPSDEVLMFRVFLCALLQNNKSEADLYFSCLSPAGKTAAWHYAKAARFFQEKEVGLAQKNIEQARLLYPNKTAFFDATFEQLNWR